MDKTKTGQRGIALLMSLVILLLLSAIAVALVCMANTASLVNANYRSQQVLYFAAKAGIEEARDRLIAANANTVAAPTCSPSSSCLPVVPSEPTSTNGQILYILGGQTPAAVKPWALTTVYGDDERCHNGYNQLVGPKSG